ncbi:swarming motility regulation sensor protein RssA [Lachnospiraceae bacterium]|nr:swarming motility regulation sensor protein RssA [Lachnospiraceae bacterium]
MELWLWAIIGIMALVIITLLIKIYFLQKAAKEIANAFADRLKTDTNILIDISCNDRYMRNLANTINREFRKLRVQRHRFQYGNQELKTAIANISHDLRTPLTAVCGYLDLLEQEEKSENAKRYIEVIRNRSEMLMQLTEELFGYSVIISKDSNTVKETVSINGILEESIASYYTALNERGITPKIQMPKNNVIRTLNRSSLARVFSNILNNAIKYSDGDLDITLSDTCNITFTNTASGLNEVQVGKLFDRFYTVEAARKSTGLGLAIARTLIEQMNGTISAKYFENRLCISISFPDAKA